MWKGLNTEQPSFPAQVVATLKFAPAKWKTEQIELLLPPIYLYKKIAESPKIHLNFEGKDELNLERSVSLSQGRLIIEKAWLEKDQLYISYRLEATVKPETIVPYFELMDNQEMKQGSMRFDQEKPQVIVFPVRNEEAKQFELSIDSMGQLLPREKFTLDMRDK